MSASHPSGKGIQYGWQKAYKAAALEPNKTRLVDKIHTAEATLMTRLSELTDRKEDETELNALEKAIKAIRTIKKKRLGFE